MKKSKSGVEEGTGAAPKIRFGATLFPPRRGGQASATAKALMINTAYSYSFATPYFLTRAREGWGMPDVRERVDPLAEFFIVDQSDAPRAPPSRAQTIPRSFGGGEFQGDARVQRPGGKHGFDGRSNP